MRQLTSNPPIDRLKYIQKTYGEKQPWVVLDTLSVIFPTIGVDNPEEELEETLRQQGEPVWGERVNRMVLRLRSMFGPTGKLHEGLVRATSDDVPEDFPYHSQLDYWWFGTGDMEDYLPSPRRPASTLSERLALILELLGAPAFADGAMREPHEADGIFPWVARELSKLAKQTVSEMEEAGPARRRAVHEFYGNKLRALRDSGNAIAQWAKLNRIDLMKKSLAEALEAIKTFRYSTKVRQGKIVYKFSTGWTVQELRGRRELDPEGKALSHCVGTYCEAVERGDSVIYSLRDPDGVPYVTMEWKPLIRGRFTQVFGQHNSLISDEQFRRYVLDAGQENDPPLKESEVGEVVDAIRAMVVEFIDKEKGGDVRGLLLAGASLKDRDFSGMDLHDVDFDGADLRGANFSGVDLSGAALSADLTGARFDRKTDLSGASFQNARLYGVDFGGADLRAVAPRGFRYARYNKKTIWPDGFRPDLAGAELDSIPWIAQQSSR